MVNPEWALIPSGDCFFLFLRQKRYTARLSRRKKRRAEPVMIPAWAPVLRVGLLLDSDSEGFAAATEVFRGVFSTFKDRVSAYPDCVVDCVDGC